MGLTVLAWAQSTTYHAFKFDIGLGYAIPTANSNGGTKAGATFTLQPHYRLSDALALGIRFEGAALGYVDNSATSDKAKIHLLESYCATGEYYLMNGGFRPFVGAGAGFFAQSALQKESGTEQLVASNTNFGFFPEIGFEAGHFRMSADYDIAGSNNNYFAFKIGFFLGGGKK